ncbi:MAG: hypothetical protein M2R45_04290 [Verrucomicrobia subdivision 3 bacterium]|nr:hypothetical protein [Limisphaerales bacterium]MCS1413500.1 hypothetical protein [Limisphaerales bacterium]
MADGFFDVGFLAGLHGPDAGERVPVTTGATGSQLLGKLAGWRFLRSGATPQVGPFMLPERVNLGANGGAAGASMSFHRGKARRGA